MLWVVAAANVVCAAQVSWAGQGPWVQGRCVVLPCIGWYQLCMGCITSGDVAPLVGEAMPEGLVWGASLWIVVGRCCTAMQASRTDKHVHVARTVNA